MPTMAELPAANPSSPSVRFVPFETAVTTKMVISTKSSQVTSVL